MAQPLDRRRGRLLAAILAFLLVMPAVLPTPGAAAAQAAAVPPASMPVISRGVPAHASSALFPASNANDGDYSTQWRSSGAPAWLAYDLSGVPVAQRTQILLAWYNDPTTPDYEHTLAGQPAYNLPRAYTIEANRAAGGGAPPDGGWVLLGAVESNTYHSWQHLLGFSGFNWIRINVTQTSGVVQNMDAALNMDIHNAAGGNLDSWIFYGDYFSAGGMDHSPRGKGTFSQQINAARNEYFPAQEAGGIGYAQSGNGAEQIGRWLRTFPGQFVALSYGTTDADDKTGPNEADFYKNYRIMVEAVIAAGKTPIVPKIPYGTTARIQSRGPALNAEIDKLYRAFPQILRGPDFWAVYAGRQDLIAPDGLNLTAEGLILYREEWVRFALDWVYSGNVQPPLPGGSPSPSASPSSSPLPVDCSAGRLFPETGKCVRQPFLAYWESHGGLAINGFPISDEFTETLDGKPYLVQYFERVRMEYHPENNPPYDVLLGQFGRTIHGGADPSVPPIAGATYFPETGHNVSGGFLAYWQANGGLAQFGFPITEVITETLEDGKQYQVQYFERARFEYHPENAAPYDILLGQFGRAILGRR